MTENTNILISSQNRAISDKTSSVIVNLSDDIFVNEDEELYVNMTNFHTIKSFYACQTGLNDSFKIIFKNGSGGVYETLPISISQGNYTVKSLAEEIKRLTNTHFELQYDSKLNKFIFKNTFQPNINVYIYCFNCGIFLGFKNGVEYKIEQTGTLSQNFINVSGYTNMIIRINGDIDIQNTLSNIQSKEFKQDKILGIFSLTDVPPMAVIKYDNFDAGYNFRYKVNNNKIPTFNISIINEDGLEFPDMAEWFMNLRFEKIKKQINYMEFIAKYLKDISYYVASLYAFMNFPSRVQMSDLNR